MFARWIDYILIARVENYRIMYLEHYIAYKQCASANICSEKRKVGSYDGLASSMQWAISPSEHTGPGLIASLWELCPVQSNATGGVSSSETSLRKVPSSTIKLLTAVKQRFSSARLDAFQRYMLNLREILSFHAGSFCNYCVGHLKWYERKIIAL